MKSLKYEGMIKLKIFWSLRRLEAGLSGFKSIHISLTKLTPSLFLPNQTRPPSFLINKNRTPPPPSEPERAGHSSSLHFLLFPTPTHTLIRLSWFIKLSYFCCSSSLLLGSIEVESDLWLVVGNRRRNFSATASVFPANDGGGWQGGPLFYHFHVFSSCFNFIFLISFPFSCSSSVTT